MVKLIADNEHEDGFTSTVEIKGNGSVVIMQLTTLFDRIYEKSPKLFESALLLSRYTEDHT